MPSVAVPTEPQLVCVGWLCEVKGQLLLLEAMAQLAAEGLTFKLVLVGDGSLRTELETLAVQLGLQDRVEIVGWASNSQVRQHVLASQVLVVASFAEVYL